MVDKKLWKLYKTLKKDGLLPEKEKKILEEIYFKGEHKVPNYPQPYSLLALRELCPYLIKYNKSSKFNEFNLFQGMPISRPKPYSAFETLDELLDRDKKREEDGFPKKIRLGKIVKPGKGKQGKVVVVPVTTEDKLIHDDKFGLGGLGNGQGGSGEGEKGEVIGEDPLEGEGDGEGEGGEGAGEGEGGEHGIEEKAYELGRILTEKFELPNLKDKGKKRAVKKYTYDLTDRNRGHGQFLDKKETLKQIVETNLSLGNIDPEKEIDTAKFLVSPNDKIYRVLSRETEYESEAVVFLLRDYSGSMWGKPTEVVVTQHLFLYAWLLYQYQKLVTPRFIVHDTAAKEVPDFHTYYNISIAGGTDVSSAFKLVNKIVEEENLARDYNIYVFYGGDGQDWFDDGKETISELEKILTYANRVGLTILPHWGESEVERYIQASGLLEDKPDLIKMDVFDAESATEERIIEGIINLIS